MTAEPGFLWQNASSVLCGKTLQIAGNEAFEACMAMFWRTSAFKKGQSKFGGDLINSARDVTPVLFSMRRGRDDPFVHHADGHEKLSRLAGGRAPQGRRGSHAHGVVTPILFAVRRP